MKLTQYSRAELGLRTARTGSAPRMKVRSRALFADTWGHNEWLRGPDRFHGRQEKYTLVRCPACSLVWLSHPPKPAEMHLHYTDAYDKLISASGQNSPHRWRARKAALMPHKQSGALLDLGCSSGSFLESLKGEAWKLYGIEMSADCAKIAEAEERSAGVCGGYSGGTLPPRIL